MLKRIAQSRSILLPVGAYKLKWQLPDDTGWIRRLRDKPDAVIAEGETAVLKSVETSRRLVGQQEFSLQPIITKGVIVSIIHVSYRDPVLIYPTSKKVGQKVLSMHKHTPIVAGLGCTYYKGNRKDTVYDEPPFFKFIAAT